MCIRDRYGIRPRHDALRHAGQLGHVDTEGVLASSPFQLTQEDDFLIHFAHRHVIVLHAGIQLLHLVQLMVMRGEERPCPPFFIFMDVFHDSPRDADTVVRRRAKMCIRDRPYMVYCHEWLQNWDGTIEKIELKPDLSGSICKGKLLFKASASPWSREVIEGDTLPNRVTDGPYLFRTQTGRLGMI